MSDRNFSTELAVQEWLAEQTLLRQILTQIDEVGDGESWSLRVAGMLRELRWRMDSLFARKSERGYLVDAIDAAPRFARQCENLEQNHRMYCDEVDSLIELVENAEQFSAVPFQKRLRSFVRRYLNHEHHETAIMQTALETDIGVGD
ncbi:MAG: hypothetical protein WDZ51_08875 [Pirellulaceae bacterium]